MSLKNIISARFPLPSDSPHTHYSRTCLERLEIERKDEKSDIFLVKTSSNEWNIKRSESDFKRLDHLLHTCLVSRQISKLSSLSSLSSYCRQLNRVLSEERVLSALKCLLILNWFEIDNFGHKLILPEEAEVNRRALCAAIVISEDTCEPTRGEVVSVLERVSLEEGKHAFKVKNGREVVLIEEECLQIIENSESIRKLFSQKRRHSTTPFDDNQTTRRHFPLLSSFFNRMVSRAEETQNPKPKTSFEPKKVFGRDLSELLFESGSCVPHVLSTCSQFIEKFGIFDGIYRLSGINSNIDRLKEIFESGLIPDLDNDPLVLGDVHSVGSLLKLFFRLLPNPLLTFESFDSFVSLMTTSDDSDDRLTTLRSLVRLLPPPHFTTLRLLIQHLKRVSLASERTGMTAKNLSIVWAPNLLRSRDLETRGGDLAALRVIGIQAVLTEFLIENCEKIFDDNDDRSDDRKTTISGRQKRRIGSFSLKRSEKNHLIRSKSFDSFFLNEKLLFNFVKSRLKVDLIPIIFELNFNSFLFYAKTLETIKPLKRAIITSTTATTESVVVCRLNSYVVDDTIVVNESSIRERIEKLKEKRRKELKERFEKNEKPVPIPRTRLPVRLPVPVATPRRPRVEEIRILRTKKTKN